ncbi:MAG TPA: VWA domain-containing protein [Pyrinomonadaceae bacterium]|nr:VWA domain-containing protein [Pyrinomonadaceae bacterium]
MMKTFVITILALAVSISPFQTQQKPEDVVRFRSNEVRLDIVVKDKKGRLVKDLTAADFEVAEDGIGQQIQSFRFVNREGPAEGTVNPNAAANESRPETLQPSTSRTTPGVTALVFDRLSPEARSLARKAGLAYTQEGMAAGDFTGVFRIDQSLITLQSFTDNTSLVKDAVGQATGAAGSTYVSGAQRVRDLADRNIALDQQVDSAQSTATSAGASRDSAGASAAGAAAGQASAEQKLNELESNILRQFEELERDQQGFATINGLLAVINPMRNLPGRKTIIFFSEGIALPPSVQTKFPSVISAANRANVAIYTIDAAGLRTESGTAEAARELNSLAAQRMQQQGRGNDRGVNGPYTKSLERNEELLRFDPRSGLGQLSDQTGGFLIHDTNDLTNGLRRISDDMHGYYMVTYVPKNEDYDGRFRQIAVKVNRSNVEVQTRKGYYAVEAVGQLPVLDYEAPAIAAARNARSTANQFSFHGAAFTFPAPARPGLTLILAEAPLSAFSFAPVADKKTYAADFSVVALIKDQSGQVIQKLSQHYPLAGPIDQMDSARKGDLLFYRETQLPAGTYSVELIAYDQSTKKTSVHTSPVELSSVEETKPRLSSVAILKRAERLTPEEQKKNHPFHFGELLVYPNLGEPISKSQAKQLAFFVTASPPKGSTANMELNFMVLQNNRAVGKSSTPLPTPDEQGQIKYASSFSLADFQPGDYELRVTVSDGKNSVSNSTQFTLTP